jgi:hypothetical protein
MKPSIFTSLILLGIAACGQKSNNNAASQTNSATKDTVTIYRNLSLEVCECTNLTMRNSRPSTTIDSCYKIILAKYTDSLKSLGFDPATSKGDIKLSNEFIGKLYRNCPDLSRLMREEYETENAKKLLFTGTIVSQKQLTNGEVEIVLINEETKKTQTFKSKSFLTDPSKTDRNNLNYQLTVEYEVIRNEKKIKTSITLKKIQFPQ